MKGDTPHAPKPLPKAKRSTVTAVSWLVCQRCGLVYLGNPATEKALKKSCSGVA